MLKAGDILKFESSQYWFDEKYPEGRYIVTEDRNTEWNQDEFEVWHCKDLDETELRLNYKLKNGSYGVGLVEKYLDKNFKVIGNIFEEKIQC